MLYNYFLLQKYGHKPDHLYSNRRNVSSLLLQALQEPGVPLQLPEADKSQGEIETDQCNLFEGAVNWTHNPGGFSLRDFCDPDNIQLLFLFHELWFRI